MPDGGNNHSYGIVAKILIMFLSFVPGCGHMYMGLMKRGMFILFSFFSCSYLATSIFFRVFTFAFIIIWFFSIFDAYNCRKKLMEGKIVEDTVDDIKKFLMKHRNIIVCVFGIITIIEVTRSSIIFDDFVIIKDNINSERIIFDNIMIFLLVCIGLYCLFFKKKK